MKFDPSLTHKLYELTYDVKIIDPEIEKIISKEKYNTKSIECFLVRKTYPMVYKQ